MKSIAPIVAILAAAFFVAECSAQQTRRPRRPGAPNAERGAAGDRAGDARRRPGGIGQMDPAQMVGRLIQQFDKDGDKKLDAKELTAMLKMMRERRGQMGQGRPGQRPQQGNAAGRRRGGDRPARPGGDLPKRPGADVDT